MDTFEIQRKIFTIAAVLLIISALSMAAVIPAILLDPSATSTPVQAAIGTFIGMGIHLLVFFGLLRGIRLTKRQGKIRNEMNYFLAFGLFVFGFAIMDGAFAFIDDVLYISIGMFLCAFCDIAASLVFVAAIFLLRKRKKK